MNQKDERVHLIIYFFDGKHENMNDFQNIKVLQRYANVLPVIGKADSFTDDALK